MMAMANRESEKGHLGTPHGVSAKRYAFALQEVTFWAAKPYLSQPKTLPLVFEGTLREKPNWQ